MNSNGGISSERVYKVTRCASKDSVVFSFKFDLHQR